tara:strand:+ start:848 stop:1561 length:714 start_codon:yes stop_codon:yes gene_type:complete
MRHFIDISTQLECWYHTDLGQYLLNTEIELVNRQIDDFFGHHLLQIGVASNCLLFENSPIKHKMNIGMTEGSELITKFSDLPFAPNSLDIILFHHSLEFYVKSHQLLREAHRCLRAEGRLVIVGFNPYSFLGIYTILKGKLPGSHWKQKLINVKRLSDWLVLLGFDVSEINYGFALPPLQNNYFKPKMSFCDDYLKTKNFPLGGIFVITACKRLPTLTSIRSSWKKVRTPTIGLTAS